MVFGGAYLILDKNVNYFKIIKENVQVHLDRLADGTHIVILSETGTTKILFVIQHHTLLMHPKTTTFLWSEMQEGDSKVCYCFRFRSKGEYDIFEQATTALQRLNKCSMVHQSLLLELKMQKIDDIGRLLTTGSIQRAPRPRGRPKGSTKLKSQSRMSMKEAMYTSPRSPRSRPMPVVTMSKSNKLQMNENPITQSSAMKYNSTFVNRAPATCHCCKKEMTYSLKCPKADPEHIFCVPCIKKSVGVDMNAILFGKLTWDCPACRKKCSCTEQPPKPEDVEAAASAASTAMTLSSFFTGGVRCVLCTRPTSNALKVELHPFVQRNGQGQEIYCCGRCRPGLMKRHKDPKTCSVCAESSKRLSTCGSHDCDRIYCLKCLHRLLNQKQLNGMKSAGAKWTCPTCEYKNSLPPVNKELDHVDYFANYVNFILGREGRRTKKLASEDVCFCCKDGGTLIECDWNKGAKCLKLYHTECLGFEIPEDQKEWICPRHHCADCRQVKKIDYCCRFCTTSFCKSHLPADTTILGPATQELEDNEYIVCKICMKTREEAVERKLLEPDVGLQPMNKKRSASTTDSPQRKTRQR